MSTQPDVSAQPNSPAAEHVNPVYKKLGALFADVAGGRLTRDVAFTYIRDYIRDDLLVMKHADRDPAILAIVGMFDGQPETQLRLIDRVYGESRIGDEELQKKLFSAAKPLLENLPTPSEKLGRLSWFFSTTSWKNVYLQKAIYQTMVGVLDEFGTAAEKFEAALFVASSVHHEDVADYENILISLALGQDSRIQSFEALKKVYERYQASDDAKNRAREKAGDLIDGDVPAREGYDISEWVYTHADDGSALKARMADSIMDFIGRLDTAETKLEALKNVHQKRCYRINTDFPYGKKRCPIDQFLVDRVIEKSFSIVGEFPGTKQQLDAALWISAITEYTSLKEQSRHLILSLIDNQDTPRARLDSANYVYSEMPHKRHYDYDRRGKLEQDVLDAIKRLKAEVAAREEKSAPMTPEEFKRFAAGWVEKPPVHKM